MKITNSEGLGQIRPTQATPRTDSTGAAGFGELLKDAVDRPDVTGNAQDTSGLAEPQALNSIVQTTLQPAGLAKKASRVIDMLDTYASDLADPRKTLKDIEPALNAFTDEAQSLHDQVRDGGNTSMKEISEKLLMTAKLEAIRFRRGDYLDND